MGLCPNDCAIPDVRRARGSIKDLPYNLLLLFPYRCHTCGQRFFRMRKWGPPVIAVLLIVGVVYPLSFVIARPFEQNVSVVQKVYAPLHWLVDVVR